MSIEEPSSHNAPRNPGEDVASKNTCRNFPRGAIVAARFVGRKQKSRYSKSTIDHGNAEARKRNNSNDKKITSDLPKDAAAHFGAFYGVQGGNGKKSRAGSVKHFTESTAMCYKTKPRLEFTRQMVQKLERTAGTEEYARQVSALLEETVEPAHFKLHSLPAENSIPDGRYNPSGYPLWYKEPYKMPFSSDEMYKILKEKVRDTGYRTKDAFDEESSERNSWDELSEYDEEDEQENFAETNLQNLLNGEKSSVNLSSTGSSSVTEAKDTDSKEGN